MVHSPRKNATAFRLISAFTLLVVLPFIKLGIPSGHDFEFHFNSWIEVVKHWKQGSIYPNWAALSHYGYGEARFIFYPPLSWMVGGLLGTVVPWKLVPAVYIWIVLSLAAISMFLLAKEWLPRRDAMFAAVLYAANPYNLVIVYWRSAMAELMAAIYLPLLLLFVLRLKDDDRRGMVAPLSLLLGAGWLTNIPSAVMMNYSLAVLAVMIALRLRSLRFLAYIAASFFLGALLAGFYLLPVFHQQSWVNIGQVLAPGVRPVDNFLFTKTADSDHNRFNLLVSIVAASQIAILSVIFWFRRRFERQGLWQALLAWSIVCVLLMIKPTLPLWLHLPELRFVQLPWRWLLCLNVSFALAVAFVVRRRWGRALLCAGMLAVILVVWHRVQTPWWDNAADLQEMLDNQQDGVGNEGVDEYVPAGADPYDINQNAVLARFDGYGSAHIDIQKWFAEKRLLTANATTSGNVVLRLFNYPLWRVRVNGRAVQTGTTPHTGQMVVPIAAGESWIEISFVQGSDRIAGLACSLFAVFILIGWYVLCRKRTLVQPQHVDWTAEG